MVRKRQLWLWTLLLLGAGCSGDSSSASDNGVSPPVDGALADSAGKDQAAADSVQPSDHQAPSPDTAVPGGVVPPLGGSSAGSGGTAAPGGKTMTAPGGVSYYIIVPGSYQAAAPNRMMVVYSGTEGAAVMTQNLAQVAGPTGLGDVIFAVLDGKVYYGNGGAGATVLDHVRSLYNIDNDRTYLLSESAGTSAGLQLGFALRQSYFAAYWANDVNASGTPSKTAAQLGFAPWGNVGPGGQIALANVIVNGMKAAGYRLPADAPYSGAGSTTHGSTQQFLAAMAFFGGKARQ
jgi:hypothetical protein